MQTKITNGEATYWVGMSESQLKVLRFAVCSLLLAKEIDTPIAKAMERTDSVIDPALMWETVADLEHAVNSLAQP